MKNIITAIGNEELNNELKRKEEVNIVNSDIQYQEGIIETIERYPNIDMVIISEEIIGNLELEDLIRSIIIIKNDIEIIIITEQKEIFESNNIVKIVEDKENYVEIISKYILGEIYIKKENKMVQKEMILYENKGKDKNVSYQTNTKLSVEKKNEVIRKMYIKIKEHFQKKKKQKEVITIIGSSGSRKNYFYITICKVNKEKSNFNYRF